MRRRAITSSRQGSFFVPLVAAAMIIFLILGYIILVRYFAENDRAGLTKSIGSKQAAILTAVQEGERIHLYAESALRSARDETLREYVCGDPYLGRRLVSEANCPQTFPQAMDAAFAERLTRYPDGSLANSFTPLQADSANPDVLLSYGEKRIPIEGAELAVTGTTTEPNSAGYTAARGTFSGSVAGWPTDTKRITSYFGARDAGVAGATKNHPGMDISVNGQAGQPIYSIADGIATFHDRGVNSFVQVVSGPMVIDYMHTRPTAPVALGRSVPVTAGQQIAVSAPYSASAPHLHLQVSSSIITPAAAQNAWPGHVGRSSSVLPSTTYGVIDSSGTRLLLNPICFFDRNFVDSVERSGISAKGDPYEACHAYEQTFGLSRRIASNPSTASPVATTPTQALTQPTSATSADSVASPTVTGASATSPATSKNTLVRETYAALAAQPGLLEHIDTIASAEGIDRALMLGIITQESQGNPEAISVTGAAGIAQFTAATARDYFGEGARITACCTAAQAAAETCRNSGVRACFASNDDRFDPKLAVAAKGKLLAKSTKRYAAYDQQLALVLIDYNAGAGAAQQIIARAGSNPTWEQLKNVIQNDVTINYGVANPAKKRIEVVQYVERITQQIIPEWGGVSIAGTSFGRERVGEYTLHFSVSTKAQPLAARAVESIKAALERCTTQSCLDDAIAAAAAENSVTITPEPLDSQNGCMGEAERAQALFANQLAWCKLSPDDECLCPLPTGKESTMKVSAREVSITKSGNTVVRAAPMPGLAFNTEGDGASLTQVKYYDGSEVEIDDEVTLIVSETGDAEISRLLFDDAVHALRKRDSDGGLSFSSAILDNENTCIMPERLKPVAYCIKAPDNAVAPIVFYLQPTLAPEATLQLKQYQARSVSVGSSAIRASVLSDRKAAFARIRYSIRGDTTPREEWLRIAPTAQSLTQLLGSTFIQDIQDLLGGRKRVIEYTHLSVPPLSPNQQYVELYDVIARPQIGETMLLTFYDESMNEVGSMPLEPQLDKDASGVVMAADIIEDIIKGAVTGTTGVPVS